MPDAMENLRARYPQYKDIPDAELAEKITKKYPVYRADFARYLKPEKGAVASVGRSLANPKAPPQPSSFALKTPAGQMPQSTIGQARPPSEPNLLQKTIEGGQKLLGYPQALVSSALFPLAMAGHTPRTPGDAANVKRLLKMNVLQRAGELNGEVPLDPRSGQPSAQAMDEAGQRRAGVGHQIAHSLAKTATKIQSDPVAHLLGPAGEMLGTTGRVGISAAFGSQMALSGAQKIQRARATGDASEMTEGLTDLGMGLFVLKHGAKTGTEGAKAAKAGRIVTERNARIKATQEAGAETVKQKPAAKRDRPTPTPAERKASLKARAETKEVRPAITQPEPQKPVEVKPEVKAKVSKKKAEPEKAPDKPAVKKVVPASPKPTEDFAAWVDRQPKGRIYTKASDLYQAYKMEHPKTTREEFGQMFQRLAVSEGHEVVTPSGNTPESGVFTFKDSTGKMVRVSGVRPAAAKPADVPAAPAVRLSATVANTLGANLPKGHALGDRLSAATKGMDVTPEEAQQLRDLIVKQKLDPKLFKPLYSKDVQTAQKGAQEAHAGVNPFQLLRDAARSEPGQKARDFLIGDKPALSETSTKGHDAVTQYEHARTTQRLEAQRVVPEVTAHLPPEDRDAFLTYGIADRILGLKEKMQKQITDNQAKDSTLKVQETAARRAASKAFRGNDRKAFEKAKSVVDGLVKERRDLAKQSREAGKTLDGLALERKTNPLTVTEGGKTKRITESDVDAFFQKPDVAKALALHKSNVEPLLNRNQIAQGNAAGVSVGKYTGSYFPAEALDKSGGSRVQGSSKGGRHAPSATLAQNTHANEFRGSGSAYQSDYGTTMQKDLENSYSRAAERNMHHTLMDEGVEQIYEDSNLNVRRTDGKLEINVSGKWEPGVDFTIQKGMKIGGKQIQGVTDGTLPTRLVLPTRVYKEMQPLFDPHYQSAADRLTSNWFGRYMNMYLLKPADMVQHGAALGSRATYGALQAPMPGIQKTAKAAVSTAQSVTNFIRFFNPNLYPEATRYNALRYASEAGILPKEFGEIKSKLQIGHNKLYGPKGILANAATSVYNEFEKRGALSTPEGKQMLKEALRNVFNTQGATDQAESMEWLRKLSAGTVGTFYQTGVKNRTAQLSAGAHVYAAALAGRALLTIGLVSAADDKHRMPWQIPGYKWGYIPLWKDEDGRTLYVDGRLLDRTGYYPDVWIQAAADATNRGLGPKGGALTAASDLINFAAAPAVSGPGTQVASSIAGPIPYFYPNRDLSALELGRSPLEKYGYTPKRALGVAASALPTAGLLFDPAAEAAGSSPKNEKMRLANRVLPFFGLPTIRAGQDEAVLLLNSEKQEKAQERTEEKAAGTYVPKQRGRSLLPDPGASMQRRMNRLLRAP